MCRDILFILDNLRAEDEFELVLQYGSKWKSQVFNRIKRTQVTILKDKNEMPFAMGGIDGKNEVACVWLLTTKKVTDNKFKLLKEIKKQLDFNSQKYSIYFNYICNSNKLAKNWLLKFGFKFDNPKPKNLKVKQGFEFFYRVNNRKG